MNGEIQPVNGDVLQKAYVCTHVFEKNAPVTLVSRPEGDWCFLCGEMHDDSAYAYQVVGIDHLFEMDATLESVRDLQPNHEAEREAVGARWLRTRIDPDD